MLRQLLVIIFLLSLLALNVAAEKISFLDRIRQFDNQQDDTCNLRCAAAKNACSLKCNEFAYSICNHNCFSQVSKCKQDCKGLNFIESRLKQSRKIENLFLKFSKKA